MADRRSTKPKDLANQRFGKLVAVERVPRPEGGRRGSWWRCICDCGKEHVTRATLLSTGRVSSCGCMGRARPHLDVTGGRYGILTAVRLIEVGSQGAVWEFKCDCGTVTNVRLKDVRYGNTASCGCKKTGPGGPHRKAELDINRPWRKADQVDDRWLWLVGERAPRMAA
jgi:hypothetical protein